MAMIKTVNRLLRARKKPDMGAEKGLVIFGGTKLKVLGDKFGAQEKWSEIKVIDSPNDSDGFVKTGFLVDLAETGEEVTEVECVDFALACLQSARIFGVNGAYLIALAWVSSNKHWDDNEKITVFTDKNTGLTGPFNFSSASWQVLVIQFGEEQEIFASDISDPFKQCTFAAIQVKNATDDLKESLEGNRLPSSEELYIAHVLGVPTAKVVLAGDPTDSMRDLLLKAKNNNPGIVDKLLQDNAELLTHDGSPKTLEGVLNSAGAQLERGYQVAEDLLAKLPEDQRSRLSGEVPANPTDADAPWMPVAKKEFGTIEFEGPNSNPEVEKYFTAVGPNFNARPDDVAWCAAFLAWCLDNSGSPEVKEKSIKSALAADWLKLPGHVAEPVYGAIAITVPLVKGASGHVGFVTVSDGSTVTLLGGNQGNPDQVCEKKFAAGKIRGYRWITASAPGGVGTGTTSSEFAAFAPLLNLIGGAESQNNYNAFIGNSNNQDNPRLTTMTLKQVRTFQDELVNIRKKESGAVGRYQIIGKTLNGLKSTLSLKNSDVFNEALQDRLAVQLLKGRGLQKYMKDRMDIEEFAFNLSKEWAALPKVIPPNPASSFFAGVGSNRALVKISEILAALRAVRA